MATLYFNNAVNQSPTELGNYWTNSACTTPAGSLPNWSVDEVHIKSSATFDGDYIGRGTAAMAGEVTGVCTWLSTGYLETGSTFNVLQFSQDALFEFLLNSLGLSITGNVKHWIDDIEPGVANVKSGVTYGSLDEYTGTYDPLSAAVWPAEANVSTVETAWGPTGANYAGALDLSLYVLISSVVAAEFVAVGHDNYTGGDAGTYEGSGGGSAAGGILVGMGLG